MTATITRIFSRREAFNLHLSTMEFSCSDVLQMPTRQDIAEGRAPGPDQFSDADHRTYAPVHVRALYGGLYSIDGDDASWDHNGHLESS